MAATTPFKYVDFYDVPRYILLKYRDRLFLLTSCFNEEMDDYEENYSIQILPSWVEQRIVTEKSWRVLEDVEAHVLGEVPVKDVVFDGTRRRTLDAAFLDGYLK